MIEIVKLKKLELLLVFLYPYQKNIKYTNLIFFDIISILIFHLSNIILYLIYFKKIRMVLSIKFKFKKLEKKVTINKKGKYFVYGINKNFSFIAYKCNSDTHIFLENFSHLIKIVTSFMFGLFSPLGLKHLAVILISNFHNFLLVFFIQAKILT